MSRIRIYSLAAMAVLAAAPLAAQAQHVVGGMGEEVRIGAFGGRSDNLADNRGPVHRNGLHAAGRDKGRARTDDRYQMRTGNAQGKATALPGKHLP